MCVSPAGTRHRGGGCGHRGCVRDRRARDGWCASGVKPTIAWWNNTLGTSGTDYFKVDDIFWMSVQLGAYNEVTLTVKCGSTSRGWYGFIKPTRTGQSVFFRYPSGATIK